VRADALAGTVRRYRIMAYVTGVVLMILCFVGIPLQVFANNLVVVNDVGTLHGILYLIYLAAAYLMTRQVGMKLASPQTVVVLLAGTIPVLTFVVERWVTRRYINPALAAAAAGRGGPGAARAPAADPGNAAAPASPASPAAPAAPAGPPPAQQRPS
jgi:integral membrane protein